jgi:hypothetical protein
LKSDQKPQLLADKAISGQLQSARANPDNVMHRNAFSNIEEALSKPHFSDFRNVRQSLGTFPRELILSDFKDRLSKSDFEGVPLIASADSIALEIAIAVTVP